MTNEYLENEPYPEELQGILRHAVDAIGAIPPAFESEEKRGWKRQDGGLPH